MNTKMLVVAAVLTAALGSQALAQTTQRQQQHSINPRFDVYENGEYVGSDPDPNIRLQLRRQHDSGQW